MIKEAFGFGNSEKKDQLATEGRNNTFSNNQMMMESGLRPEDDSNFLQVKEQQKDLVRWQQDLDDTIEMLRHDLMNEILTEEGWQREMVCVGMEQDKPIYKENKPMINYTGVYRVITLVKRYLSRNFMMSNYDEETIYRVLRRLNQDLVINMGTKYREYDVDPADMSLVVKMVMDSVEATLNRALNNGERNHLNTINKRIEAHTDSTNPQQTKGLLGGLMN